MPSSTATASSPSSSSTDHASDTAAPRGRRARVSAEHTLNRVRENQRRHRARQRDHVTSLEQKLAETEKLLAEARAEIALLREEAAACTASTPTATVHDRIPGQAATTITTTIAGATTESSRYDGIENDSSLLLSRDIISTAPPPSSQQLPALIQPQHSRDYPDGSPLPDLSFFSPADPSFYLPPPTPTTTTTSHHLINLSSIPDSTTSPTIPTTVTGPPPCCSDPPNSPPPPGDQPIDLECSSCKTRPPPAPTESTTLCAQAYVMISQQNFRNLDPDTIRLWLAQGLRRAQREGEGCRVENGALLRLLDFISGL